MKVSVILPAYNEEESLKELLPRIFSALGPQTEVLVVDDGSSDSTESAAKACGAKVIKNPYNMGNGASVKRGIRAASGEVIVLMDADGQHSPEDAPRLLAELGDYDMVVGSRTNSPQVWFRGAANKIYNWLASYITGIDVKDLTSGFRVFKKNKAARFLYLLPNTFSYPSTLTMSFLKEAYPVKFMPINVAPRAKGKSKINLIADGSRFLIIIMRVAVFFSPLKVFLPVSLLFFAAGALYYLYTFLAFHRFTNMSALLFTTSVIVFMLGLVSEQIAALRLKPVDEEKQG